MLTPNPKDIIAWGIPNRPVKKYQVSNKVYEKNVRSFTYQKHHMHVIDFWMKKEYPFEQKREFLYTQKGICKGYIDSTFSEDVYVTRIISEIQYNNKKEPVRVIHRKENPTNETEFFSLETFEYEK